MAKVVSRTTNYSLNYMLDTCTINRLADSEENTKLLFHSIQYGYRYYKTDVQDRELIGIPDRTLEYEKAEAWKTSARAKIAIGILDGINAERIPCVATPLRNFWLLDGSMRLWPDKGTGRVADMMDEIFNGNIHHMRDAVIAEATVFSNCILITADKRLYKKLKNYYPENVINYCDFLSKITDLSS